MLVIVILAFLPLLLGSLNQLGESYADEIEFYRSEVRMNYMETAFTAFADTSAMLGMLPGEKDDIANLVRYKIGLEDNYLLSDSAVNVHSPYVHYKRSAEVGSKFESDRAVFYTQEHAYSANYDFLGSDNNSCVNNEDFESGESWCPNPINDDFFYYRVSTQEQLANAISMQETQVRFLVDKISNYVNVNRDFPPSGSNTDLPLYEFITDSSGNNFNASTDECEQNEKYKWGNMPIDCRDLFSYWHVDGQGSGVDQQLASLFSVSNTRLKVPVRIFRDNDEMTVYVETPFERYGTGAWSSTSLRRGEQRPNGGTPALIYSSLRK